MTRQREPSTMRGRSVAWILSVLLWASVASAQSMTVANVRVLQRTGTKWADITYDLTGEGHSATVTVELSQDDGLTWSSQASTFAADGDVGTGVLPGLGKHIAWNAGADVPDRYGSDWRVRITATGGGLSGGTSVTTPAGTTHEMVQVPAGSFEMGSTANSNEQPVHTVNLDGYYLDTYEVTNAQYEAYVTTGGGVASSYANDSRFNVADHPVVGVSWIDAEGYCGWAGLRLPTEAEWEKAARGTDERTYPWGDETATCDRAVMLGGGKSGCGTNTTWPVGSKPAGVSPYGAQDMAGNVYEWVADWYASDYYGSSPDSNPTGPVTGSYRVLRGGSRNNSTWNLSASIRRTNKPSYRSSYPGFRCAQDE
jgi:formylglycine-generating enzyme required for sulfatase activity